MELLDIFLISGNRIIGIASTFVYDTSVYSIVDSVVFQLFVYNLMDVSPSVRIDIDRKMIFGHFPQIVTSSSADIKQYLNKTPCAVILVES